MIRAIIVHCPSCAAFVVATGHIDPGLWLTVHLERHPELVYAPAELERRQLEARMAGRRN